MGGEPCHNCHNYAHLYFTKFFANDAYVWHVIRTACNLWEVNTAIIIWQGRIQGRGGGTTVIIKFLSTHERCTLGCLTLAGVFNR